MLGFCAVSEAPVSALAGKSTPAPAPPLARPSFFPVFGDEWRKKKQRILEQEDEEILLAAAAYYLD